jgi:hypothetical protein
MCDQVLITPTPSGIQENNMKLREHRLAHRAQGSITNQEIVRKEQSLLN